MRGVIDVFLRIEEEKRLIGGDKHARGKHFLSFEGFAHGDLFKMLNIAAEHKLIVVRVKYSSAKIPDLDHLCRENKIITFDCRSNDV
jgi:hypothetical protein